MTTPAFRLLCDRCGVAASLFTSILVQTGSDLVSGGVWESRTVTERSECHVSKRRHVNSNRSSILMTQLAIAVILTRLGKSSFQRENPIVTMSV